MTLAHPPTLALRALRAALLADYAGKAVSNYRYGNVVFADRGPTWARQPPGCGMGADGRAPFEFGGSMAMPGKPFRVSSTNVP